MELTPQIVEEIFEKSLILKEEQDTVTPIIGEGVMANFGFHPQRLQEVGETIDQLLVELPDTFKEKAGASFLSMCEDRHGNTWTGLHMVIDYLMVLAIASGKMEFVLPRNMWSRLPGGLPLLRIKEAQPA